jgi:metallo-beta-lactamase family protein
MKITFCGATGMVTGSCYLVETETTSILVDCGLFQGGRISEDNNREPFPFEPKSIDAVLITHGHLDHCGRIPKLAKDGFSGRIIATGPTTAFAKLILEDSVNILAREARYDKREPIFTADDFERVLPLFEETTYHRKITIGDITAEFFDAGHILGSSMIQLTADGKTIVFSGDLGNPPVPLLDATEAIDSADYVVMETTYGGRTHEDKKVRAHKLKAAIYDAVSHQGVLMIPAFAIERTQEILFELNAMVEAKEIPPVSIFVDSPLAIKATRIFREYSEYLSTHVQEIQTSDDVFHFDGLHMTLTPRESKQINKHPAPKVIIAGSGMAQGGRIMHHIERYIGSQASRYLIVGYQVEGSLGRRLLDGEKKIRVNGKNLDVRATVEAIGGYSAHADQPKLTEWLTAIAGVKKVFLTHGEEDQAQAFKEHITPQVDAEIEIPTFGQAVEL